MVVEEIKVLKELLDCGIITQEEYDKKKREILGITKPFPDGVADEGESTIEPETLEVDANSSQQADCPASEPEDKPESLEAKTAEPSEPAREPIQEPAQEEICDEVRPIAPAAEANEPVKKKPSKPMIIGIAVAAVLLLVVVIFIATRCPHDVWNEATCTEAKVCVECGEVEGEPLGHDWEDATCTEPKTCARCEETEGEALGHNAGEWTAGSPDYVTASVTRYQKCDTCGDVLDKESEALDKLHDGSKFLLSPDEFCDRMDDAFDTINSRLDLDFAAASGDLDDARACAVLENGKQAFAFIFLKNGEDYIYDEDSRTITHLMGTDSSGATDDTVSSTLMALLMTLHPSLSIESSVDIAMELIETCMEGEIYKYDGVQYYLSMEDGDTLLIVALE